MKDRNRYGKVFFLFFFFPSCRKVKRFKNLFFLFLFSFFFFFFTSGTRKLRSNRKHSFMTVVVIFVPSRSSRLSSNERTNSIRFQRRYIFYKVRGLLCPASFTFFPRGRATTIPRSPMSNFRFQMARTKRKFSIFFFFFFFFFLFANELCRDTSMESIDIGSTNHYRRD